MRHLHSLALSLVFLLGSIPFSAHAERIVVLGGVTEVIDWLETENWWGEENRSGQLAVPKFLIAEVAKTWQLTASKLPVPVKKEVFYRVILPLVVHANEMVRVRRYRMTSMQNRLAKGGTLTRVELEELGSLAATLRIAKTDPADILEEALYKLDEIPAGLVLGQAAYESGYGTSRFAAEGNALFGQWTFGGKGLVPEQQREHLGDHRIAAYDWPFDSVRAYYLNLSSHPAYEDFRRIRAKLKQSDKPVTSLALADGLHAYSERGEAYVETLKSIIRVNNLDRADDAYFRDEPMRFIIATSDSASAASMQVEIDSMKEADLDMVIQSMRL